MVFSKSCEYGIRATLYLAQQREDGYVPIRRISDALSISFHFLTKIFQQLTQAGILASYKGPKGGVQLARAADTITLKDLVDAIDGEGLFTSCVLGLPGCGEARPCPLHASWAVERERLRALFATRTLADMTEKLDAEDLRLSVS